MKWYKNKELIILFTSYFLLNFYMADSILTLYFQHHGISFYKIGLIMSAYQLSQLIFEVPTGVIADRYGNKKSVLLSIVCNLISLSIYIYLSDYISYMVAIVIFGIGQTLVSGALDALIIDKVQEQTNSQNVYAWVSSITRILFYVAFGLSTLLAGTIAMKSYSLVFKSTVFIQILVFILLLYLPNSKVDQMKTTSKTTIKPSHVIKSIIHNDNILYTIALDIAVAISMVSVDNFYKNYLNLNFGINELVIGMIVCSELILSSLMGAFSQKITIKLSRQKVLCYFPLLMIMAYMVFTSLKTSIFAILFYFLGSIIFCLYSPQKYQLFQENVEPEKRATTMSIISLVRSGINIIIQPIFGLIVTLTSFNMGFKVVLLISGILIIFIQLYYYRKINLKKE